MFLRSLSLKHYGIFKDATFNLSTDVDHPLVLILGNNGAGKTSFLEALRVALHGRRAFDTPISEAEYARTMLNRFHLGDRKTECAVDLQFDYVDLHRTHKVRVQRSWTVKRQNLAEQLHVTLDDRVLMTDEAEDLLTAIVPPEIARYFFFDGERIRELAEWEPEDESALFGAVSDLLGLGVLDQLRADLQRLALMDQKGQRNVRNAAAILEEAETSLAMVRTQHRSLKQQSRKIRGNLDRARSEVRRVGAMQQDDIATLESELGELSAEKRALIDEAQRSASDILPLLCARTLRSRFGKEIEARRKVEDREIVAAFLREHETVIEAIVAALIPSKEKKKQAVQAILQIAHKGPIPVSDAALPSVSRSDAAWMQRVIERELPEMSARTKAIVSRLRLLDERINFLSAKRRDAPVNDPTAEAALAALERSQRAFLEHEALLRISEEDEKTALEAVSMARDAAKAQRLEVFRQGRIRVREKAMQQILESLPTLSERLHSSKELRFGKYLEDALRQLWHKSERLIGVEISFANRRIALLDAMGEIQKRDLSAGEKQLFAVAFIYALAKLSGRLMPFVIDTPLSRLDQKHRNRFVAEFLPKASHQVILLSTDTEIVGSLYTDIQSSLAHEIELSEFNGNATDPVLVASA